MDSSDKIGSWVQTSKGVWERPASENETFIWLVAEPGRVIGREHWAISTDVSFVPKGDLNTNTDRLQQIFKQAWVHLRFTYPGIATRFKDGKIVYQVPSSTTLQSWMNETFIVASPDTTDSDIIGSRKPTDETQMYYLPHESKVVLQTPHWRTDAYGVYYLLDKFFDLVCQYAAGNNEPIVWGEEVVRLPPSVEEAAGITHDQSPDLVNIAQKYLATFGLVSNTVGIKYEGNATTTPVGTDFKQLVLSEADSTAIFTASRARHITITTAFHASVTQANYHFADSSTGSKPHTSTIRFGLRRYASERYRGAHSPTTIQTSGYMVQVPAGRTWSENAARYGAEYRKGYDHILPAHRLYAKMLCDTMRAMPPPDPENPPCDMDISSFGIIDRYIKPLHQIGDAEIEVTNVTLGVETVSRQMCLYVWTFRGRLNMYIAYNKAYHGENQVDEILQYVKQVTMQELGISPVDRQLRDS